MVTKDSDSNSNTSKTSFEDDKGAAYHSELATQDHEIDDSIETTESGKAVWLIACTVSMGGFLFGTWDISSVILYLFTCHRYLSN